MEILGTKIDQILSFHQHIKSISKITGKKLSALLRICPYLALHKKCLYLELFWSIFFPYLDWIRTRITPNTDTFYAVLKIKKVVYNTIIKFQFNYCLLFWMSRSRKRNNLVNKIQERALRLTYKDNQNNFQTLLNECNETSVHQKNLQFLMTAIYNIKNNCALPIMHHLFLWKHFQFKKFQRTCNP